jgi:hypothetical protein
MNFLGENDAQKTATPISDDSNYSSIL